MRVEEKLAAGPSARRPGRGHHRGRLPDRLPGRRRSGASGRDGSRRPVIAALARCAPGDIECAGKALEPAARSRIHTFIATSDLHLERKLRITREQCLERAVEAVTQARGFTDDVEFSAEDATRSDPDFLYQVVEAVIDAGATTINLPDTVGYSHAGRDRRVLPAIIAAVPNARKAIFSTHCHDDLGLAVANSARRHPRRRAAGRVHDQRHRRARRQRLARGDRDGVARAPRSRAVHDRHRHAARSSPSSQLLTEADRRGGAGQQGDRRAERLRARGRHPSGRHAEGSPDLRDHERRGRRRAEDDAGAGQALGPPRRPEALRGARLRAVEVRAGSRLSPDDRARRSAEARVRRRRSSTIVERGPATPGHGHDAPAPGRRLRATASERRSHSACRTSSCFPATASARRSSPPPSTCSTRSAASSAARSTTTPHRLARAALRAGQPALPDETLAACPAASGAARRGRRSGLRSPAARARRSRPACWRCARSSACTRTCVRRGRGEGLEDARPFKPERVAGADLIIVRELLGGLYFGEPRGIAADGSRRYNTMRYTPAEVERVAEWRSTARAGAAASVLSVDKANVLETSQLWRRTVTAMAAGISRRRARAQYVDAFAMNLALDPRRYDVVLTENLFGDILSDEAGAVAGSLGPAAVGEPGRRPGLYEPVHGSAPTLAGKDVANPVGAIGSVAMLLRYAFSLETEARADREARSKASSRMVCAPPTSHSPAKPPCPARRWDPRSPTASASPLECCRSCSGSYSRSYSRWSSQGPSRTWQNLRARRLVIRAIVVLSALGRPHRRPLSPCRPSRCGSAPSRRASIPRARSPVEGQGWPKLEGTWTIQGAARSSCRHRRRRRSAPSRRRYRIDVLGGHPTFALIADPCQTRRIILIGATWRLASETVTGGRRVGSRSPRWRSRRRSRPRRDGQLAVVPRTAGLGRRRRPASARHLGRKTGENILLAHADSRPRALEPGRLGQPRLRHQRGQQRSEGDVPARPVRRRRRVGRSLAASLDALRARQAQREDRCGSASPTRASRSNKRHIKSTYASATPATDGRIVVAWFGSQGVYAYDVDGQLSVEGRSRPRRHGRLRHPDVRMGPGQLADHLERPGHPPVRHAGRLVPARARRRDRRDGVEDRARRAAVMGHADRGDDAGGPGAGHQRVELHPRLRPAHRQGAVAARAAARRSPRRRRSSADGLFVVASGRAPERPIFVVAAGARGDLTLGDGETQQRRRSPGAGPAAAPYMPTPLVYKGMLYVLANNGVFDAYDLKTGEEIYRQRLPRRRQRLQRVAGRGRRQDLSVERRRRDAGRRRRPRRSSRSRRTRWASC